MKKVIILLLVFLLAVSVCSCSKEISREEIKQNAQSTAAAAETTAASVAATVEPEAVKTGTRQNPVPMNATVLYDGSDSMFYNYQAELTLTGVVRGDEALQMVQEGNDFNSDPPESKEYLCAMFKIRALTSPDDQVIDINNASFSLISESGTSYDDFVVVSGVEPEITEMYAGAEQEGYVFFYVDSEDKNPSILFLQGNDGEIWFTTDGSATLAEGSEVYTPAESTAAESGADAAGETGTRANPVPVGTTALFDGMDTMFDTFKTELTLTEVVRGEEALQMVTDANDFNSEPPEGMEYILAKFKIKAIASLDDKAIDINNSSFNLVSEAGKKYEDFIAVAGLGADLTEMYSGAEQEGYVYFYAEKTDLNPTIVFLERNDSGIWFALK